MQTEIRVSLGVKAGANAFYDADFARNAVRGLPESELLRVVDYLMGEVSNYFRLTVSAELEAILAGGGSAWRVGERLGKLGLIERVPEGVRVAVESVFERSGTAGHLLARAWSHIHGVVKNDSAGYGDAVRAVEVAAIPLVLGEDPEATLGTVIQRMRADGDWRLPLREHNHAPSAEMVVQILRTLWRGHSDRHGNVDYKDVSHEEARAGVVLAATLVDWFTAGAIARRPA